MHFNLLKFAFFLLANLTIGQSLNSQPSCDSILNTDRLDCFPDYGANAKDCNSRGCCWSPPQKDRLSNEVKVDEPYCFYPKDFPSYHVVTSKRLLTNTGYLYSLSKNASTFRPKEILQLEASVTFETDKRLRGKIALNWNRFKMKN
jgi:hypothetical protein